MNRRRGAAATWRQANMSLWLWPSVVVVVAYAVGALLSAHPFGEGSFAGGLFHAGAGGARTVLTALVGGLVTALSVVFSLTITGLQLVHQQYSPRLLRNFMRDRSAKVTLAVFAGTVAYILAVLRAMPPSDSPEPVPRLAIFGAMLLFMACVGIVAYFAQHITDAIRVHNAMGRVVAETNDGIDRTAKAGSAPAGPAVRDGLPTPGEGGVVVPAGRTGYLQEADLDGLAAFAERGGLTVRLRPMIGDQVVEGTPLAWVWPRAGTDGLPDGDELRRGIKDAVEIGGDRTQDTDVAYGFRQLVDVAVRATSPSLNDPYTAVQAIDHMTVLLCRLAKEGVPDGVRRDANGAVLAAVPGVDLADYVKLACDQTRRYGAQEPAVAARLLKLLRDVGALAPEDAKPMLRAEVGRVLDHAPVEDEAEAALAWIDGRPAPQEASFVRL